MKTIDYLNSFKNILKHKNLEEYINNDNYFAKL